MTESMAFPQPNELSKREKEDAMAAYLMNFAAWGASLPLPSLNLIASAIYYFNQSQEEPVRCLSLLSSVHVATADDTDQHLRRGHVR